MRLSVRRFDPMFALETRSGKLSAAAAARMILQWLGMGLVRLTRCKVSERVVALTTEVMSLDGIDPSDDIYSLGADSLHAVQLSVAIEREFGVAVPESVMEAIGSLDELIDWVWATISGDNGGAER